MLSAGADMWLPCEVKRGPFSDGRMVRVTADGSVWLDFVNVRWLKDGGLESRDCVLARVVEIQGPTFREKIPGCALLSGLFLGRVDRAVPGDSVQT